MKIEGNIKRRDLLDWTAYGLGGAAISSLMLEDGGASQPLKPHFAPNHTHGCNQLSPPFSLQAHNSMPCYRPKLITIAMQ